MANSWSPSESGSDLNLENDCAADTNRNLNDDGVEDMLTGDIEISDDDSEAPSNETESEVESSSDNSSSELEDDSSAESGSEEEDSNSDDSNDEDSNSDEDQPEERQRQCGREQPDMNLPITPWRPEVNVGQAVTLILAYVMRHASSKVALRHLLLLLHTLLGPNRLPASEYYFAKFFKSPEGVVELHYFCYSCKKSLGKHPEDVCIGCGLRKNRKLRRADGDFFIRIRMKSQLQELLERPEIGNALTYRFSRLKSNPENVEDIFDGELYESCSDLDNPYNISLTWNTDGVQCSKASTFSIWPIQFIINELPPKLRRKNILQAGFWFGFHKPDRDLFYECFVREANRLSKHGVNWTNSDGVVINSKVFTLVCTCDTPARSLLMNQILFNGEFGCSWCLNPGRTAAKGKGHAHIYEYENNPSPLRTQEQSKADGDIAVPGVPSNGVKGKSVIMKIKSMDFIKGFSVDYLHADLSGVAKSLLKCWLDPPDKTVAYYVGRRWREINKRLMDIKPPNVLPTVPRSLSTRKKWKAKEFMYWLLFYSMPCMIGILPPRYLNHLLLLVHGLSIFLSESISVDDFSRASNSLFKFVREYANLYGIENMSFNVHSILHLPECVKNMGPLWTSSTFIYEGNNYSLVRLAHGTQDIPLQIARRFFLRQQLPGLVYQFIERTPLLRLYLRITKNLPVKSFVLENGIRGYGKPFWKAPRMEEAQALETVLRNPVPVSMQCFKRVTINGVMVHSKEYRRPRKRNSCFVKLKNGSFALIFVYCYVEGKVYALYKEARLSRNRIRVDRDTGANAPHIKIIENFSELRATRMENFKKICILIDAENHEKMYGIEIPNTIELD